MELTVPGLMQFIATIIAAGLGSWIAFQLGQWQFRSQRWWDKKAETYLSIIDGFHPLLDEEGEYWDAAQRGIEIPQEKRIELSAKTTTALAEIHKRRRLASFLISTEADEALLEMQRGLQQRADVQNRRREWFAGQLDLDPTKLVFIDETGASTNLARKSGRCRRGRRLRAAIPHSHYKTVTLIAGLRLRGLTAARTFDGPINAALFEDWVETCLVPTLSPGEIVVMDNLPAHKGPRVEQLIKAAGAQLRYLPAYSPDMNPIEKAFSKLKAFLRKIAERTVAGLLRALETCAEIFKPSQCTNYFKSCGYQDDTG